MRLPSVRKDRECIVPDVSRTYHFGTKGTNMNAYFQELYFKKHSLNTLPHVKLKEIERYVIHAYNILERDLDASSVSVKHKCDII